MSFFIILIYNAKLKKIFHFSLFPYSKVFRETVWPMTWTWFSLKLKNLLLFFAWLLILKCSYVIKFFFQNKEIEQLNKMFNSVFVFINLKINLKCATMGRRFQNMKATKSSKIQHFELKLLNFFFKWLYLVFVFIITIGF